MQPQVPAMPKLLEAIPQATVEVLELEQAVPTLAPEEDLSEVKVQGEGIPS